MLACKSLLAFVFWQLFLHLFKVAESYEIWWSLEEQTENKAANNKYELCLLKDITGFIQDLNTLAGQIGLSQYAGSILKPQTILLNVKYCNIKEQMYLF